MSDQSTSEVNETEAPEGVSELQALKARATLMGIAFSNNIGVETLRAKIEAKMESKPDPTLAASQEAPKEEPASNPLVEPDEKALSPRQAMMRKQLRLVRCRIQNLDPKKKELHGEIFTVANEIIGTVSKFVPYGEVTDGGYHLPYCIYKNLEKRKFVHIQVNKDPRTGKETVRTSMAKEFAIEVLPPLTKQQLVQLATAQTAAGSVDNQV